MHPHTLCHTAGASRRLFTISKLDAADPMRIKLFWGNATMTLQKTDSHSNPVQVSESPSTMTVAQIDQALRDFVLQDTAHLRRDAENASQSASRREPENAPRMVSELVRQMTGASLNELDETIVHLSHLRDFQHAEGERIKRVISGYLQLNQLAA
jgi:hypothetical protein